MSSKRSGTPFDTVQSQPVESNNFDLSHDVNLTFKMGSLVPFGVHEVLPGDSFSIDTVGLFRFAPLIAPVMHRVRLMTEWFFVPNRILWDGWEDFITGVGTPPEWPYYQLDDVYEESTLLDYIGIPPTDYQEHVTNVSILPFAAYAKIYDDWYRYAPVIEPKMPPVVAGIQPVSGPNSWLPIVTGTPLNRAWEHDYFTSCLPDTQQGSEVELPLTFQQNIPVMWQEQDPGVGGGWRNPETGEIMPIGDVINASGPVPFVASNAVGGATDYATYDPRGSLVVDINSEAATINDLREAFALQAFLERTLRGGERYIEQIWSQFNVKSSDARLQRPEFLGRSVQNMTISEVLSTAQSSNDPDTADVPVGQMAGHGISTGGGNRISYRAEEHGWIIGIVSALPESKYQDGIARKFQRADRFDHPWPSFANLGERPVLLKELIVNPVLPATQDDVFGYLPQYSEMRYEPSRVAGAFRSTLAFWTLGRIFDPAAPPALNEEFISCRSDAGLGRIFAVTDETEDYIFGQILNRITVNRRLPRYGVPQLVG